MAIDVLEAAATSGRSAGVEDSCVKFDEGWVAAIAVAVTATKERAQKHSLLNIEIAPN
jgi:hypothetical protein